MAITQLKGQQIGPLPLDAASGEVSGVLTAANGGTGLSSPGASGNVLTSNGTTWISAAPSGGGASENFIIDAGNATTTYPPNSFKIDFGAAT